MNTIDKATIKRLPTGVPGLDEVLGGGLPELSFNIIAGPPGCGKTTLSHQMMFALATPERPALYFTVLGEPPLKMLRYQQQFDFFDSAKVNDCVHFVNLSGEASSGDLESVLGRIVEEVKKHGPALVFVDSFRSVAQTAKSGSEGIADLQHFIQELGTRMTSWQATTFLIGEYVEGELRDNPVFTVADGLLWLSQSVHRNSMVRKMEIVKRRGQATIHSWLREESTSIKPTARKTSDKIGYSQPGVSFLSALLPNVCPSTVRSNSAIAPTTEQRIRSLADGAAVASSATGASSTAGSAAGPTIRPTIPSPQPALPGSGTASSAPIARASAWSE